MRLKKLELFGFKSFFDKTVVTFRPGINGIVGPNGCGKSNLSDAILWVMGEQSPKNLRGERMEDVIFSGTEARKLLSVAEVSLTIGDIKKELPPPYTPYGELTLCRRLYRSGESDYLINKTPCRLKDIRDLLIDTGAGYKAHTIIEQGRVDEMITASPMQRREIVEEAAGIAKYRLRKAEALRKLESTERNLVRVRDIIAEVKRQRGGLDRQAKKAAQYKQLKADLQTLECQLAHREWTQWKQSDSALAEEEAKLNDLSTRLLSDLSSLELKQTEAQLVLTQKNENLDAAQQQVAEIESSITRLEGQIQTLHAQRTEWLASRLQSDQEISKIKEEQQALENEEDSLKQSSEEIKETLPQNETLLAEKDAAVTLLEENIGKKAATLDQGKATHFDLVSKLTTAKNNLTHFQTRKEDLQRLKERAEFEQEKITTQSRASASAQKQLQAQSDEMVGQVLKKREMQRKALALKLKTEESINRSREALLSLKEALAGAKAQAASVERFYKGFLEKKDDDKNRLLELTGLKGMLADFIEAPPAYERAIEALLQSRLRGLVVEDHDEIKQGLSLIEQMSLGRAAFFPKNIRAYPTRESKVFEGEGLIGAAQDLIGFRKGYETLAEALLGAVYLVKDLESAMRLWKDFPEVEIWLSLQGEVLDRFGVVVGGSSGGKSILEEKRELKALLKEIDRLQEKIHLTEQEIENARNLLHSTVSEIEGLNEAIRTADLEQLKRENDLHRLAAELERLGEALETLNFELEENAFEAEELSQKEAAERQAIIETERLKEAREAELAQERTALTAMRQARDLQNEERIRLRMLTNSLKEKRAHIQEKQARLVREKSTLQERFTEKTASRVSLQEKLAAGKSDEEEITTEIEQQSQERDRRISEIRKQREIQAGLSLTVQNLAQEESTLQKESRQCEEDLQKLALKKVEVNMNCQRIEEEITHRYQIAISEYRPPETEGLPDDATEEGLDRLRQKLSALGAVNLAAIDEYSELDKRFQFLSTQEADLNESIEGLRAVINKINKTTRNLFVETFQKLNEKFSEVFNSFFGGGSAQLLLLDPAQPLESGIELVAQLPGKGDRKITLLSGGEKALTAISLLFATFLIHPTPFCLLDEIDAPLDEENTRRFAQALLKMSDETQFIVVTHNKLSMEIADVLYGVTMEETGISKLVSVNLD